MIGAGRVGQTIARLALAAGHPVTMAASGTAAQAQTVADLFAPGADGALAADAAAGADVVVLAMPLGAVLDELPAGFAAGRTVVDASNYWPETDGERPELSDAVTPTSVLVQRHLAAATVVKALNHVAYRDLSARAATAGSAHRIGIGVAGDDDAAVAQAASLVEELGFDAVPAGRLADSAVLGPYSGVFGAVLPAPALRERIAQELRTRGGARG